MEQIFENANANKILPKNSSPIKLIPKIRKILENGD